MYMYTRYVFRMSHSISILCLCPTTVGLLVLSVSQSEEKDMLWIVDPDLFPFKQTLIETHVSQNNIIVIYLSHYVFVYMYLHIVYAPIHFLLMASQSDGIW